VTVYRVEGRSAYLGVPPGEVFEAQLDPNAERRAVARGAIVVLDATPPGLIPGSYQPPDGWDNHTQHQEAPEGASLIEGSK
jgi:hypothetical protein